MQSDPPASRIVGLLFTDVEGSTRILRDVGLRSFRALMAEYRRRVRSAIRRRGGVEADAPGDGFFVVFPQVSDALAAALDVQRASGAVRIRIGVHSGPVDRSGKRYIGLAVHQAARIAAAAHGGQILASADAVAALRELVTDVNVEDLGYYRLRDFPEPQPLFSISASGEVVSGLPPRGIVPVTRVPKPSTALVGRGQELELICRLFTGATRLITITGTGGVGKTRLALEVARLLQTTFRDGVHIVSLGSVTDQRLLPTAVADALRLRQPEGYGLDLAAHLQSWDALVVMDNLEQLTGAGGLIEELAAACPRLRILGTSRKRLRVSGETVVELEVLAPADAASLFLERAREACPELEVDWQGTAAVRDICERLDRLPLALELAAARANVFTPTALADRLRIGTTVLAAGPSDRPARQQTLAGSFEWSYDLLSDEEQRAFRGLSTFTGNFDESAAAAVLSEAAEPRLEMLLALRDRSLLRSTQTDRAPMRWEMLQVLRQQGQALLGVTGELEACLQRHTDYFLVLAGAVAPDLASERRRTALDRLGLDIHNLRTALSTTSERDAQSMLGLAASLGWYWYHRGQFQEGRTWLQTSLSHADDRVDARLVSARTANARLAFYQGLSEAALVEADEAVVAARLLEDPRLLGHALIVLALARQANSEPAVHIGQQAVIEMERADDDWGLALGVFYLGVIAVFEDLPDVARTALDRSERLFSALGDHWGLGGVYFYLGMLSREAGELEVARKLTEESVELLRDAGDRWREATALRGLAEIVRRQGGDATSIVDEARRLREELGVRRKS